MKMLRYFFHIRKQFHLPYKIIVNGLNYFFLMLSFSKTVHPILKICSTTGAKFVQHTGTCTSAGYLSALEWHTTWQYCQAASSIHKKVPLVLTATCQKRGKSQTHSERSPAQITLTSNHALIWTWTCYFLFWVNACIFYVTVLPR